VLLLALHGMRSGSWMQAMHCCFGVGALLSPLLVRAAQTSSPSATYHLAFYGISSFLLVAALPFLLLPPPQRAAPPHAQTDGCFSRHPCHTMPLLLTPAALLVALIALILGIYVGAEVSYGAYILVYAHQRLAVDESDGQYITALFWGSLALGRLAAACAAVRLSPTRMMWLVFVGCVACSLLLLTLPTVPALWAASALLGALMAPTFPTLYTLAGSYMPVSGRVATVFVLGASAGVMMCPLLSPIVS
jgi:FHS family Na+ dependent glucose MFS transporter 1